MPDKSLAQLLSEYANGPDADSRARNRSAFLENRDEILRALDAGWSRRQVWDVLRRDGRIDFSYSRFVHYIRKYRDSGAAAGAGEEPA
jgi:nuclear transport factor 2 (NTF2) superfamily protein